MNCTLDDDDLDLFVDALVRRLASFDREVLAAAKAQINRFGTPTATELQSSNDMIFPMLTLPDAQARRAKIRGIGYGVPSDFELNFGRYLPAFGGADGNTHIRGPSDRRRGFLNSAPTLSRQTVPLSKCTTQIEVSMKRTYFPGIIDIVVVTDPAEIRTISNDLRFDRDFIFHGPVRNVQRHPKNAPVFGRSTADYFEPMLPRTDISRAAAQDELWSRLSVKADEVKHGPAQLEPLAEWVRGIGAAEKLDLLVQQSIGRLFVETFTATEESLAAAS